MPRTNRYFLPGKCYHLTHRCHDRAFLFRFAKDRTRYRQMLWESLREYPIQVFSYCVTCNHAHLLVRAEEPDLVSAWMQQVQGRIAQHYNQRKERSGAFWEGRFHSTMIEPGVHLWRAMIYIELNMVRAGVVDHPGQWRWCSYGEWMGQRQRYTLVDRFACLNLLGTAGLATFQENYNRSIGEAIAQDRCRRQPEWTESIAVGSLDFIRQVRDRITWRRRFEENEVAADAWSLREEC